MISKNIESIIASNIQTLNLLLEKPRTSILTLHRHPDPDSVASNLLWADILREYGHEVDIVSADEPPAALKFLQGFESIRYVPSKEFSWGDYDVFWALDMSSADRHGFSSPIPESLQTVVIDHHISNKGWGTVNIVDTQEYFPSTCSMLFEIAKQLNKPLTKVRATTLLTGIAGDTGFFMYGLSPEVLQSAAELIRYGADYELIKKNIVGSMDIAELQFMSQAFSQAELYKDALIITIPNDMWLTYGKSPHKNEFVVYYLSKIEGTKLGILIIEEEKRVFRLEFRSRDVAFDVSTLATALGGGGHKNAAGATLKNITLNEALTKVKALL